MMGPGVRDLNRERREPTRGSNKVRTMTFDEEFCTLVFVSELEPSLRRLTLKHISANIMHGQSCSSSRSNAESRCSGQSWLLMELSRTNCLIANEGQNLYCLSIFKMFVYRIQ